MHGRCNKQQSTQWNYSHPIPNSGTAGRLREVVTIQWALRGKSRELLFPKWWIYSDCVNTSVNQKFRLGDIAGLNITPGETLSKGSNPREATWRCCSRWVTNNSNRKLKATHLVDFNTSTIDILLRIRSNKAKLRDAEHITHSRLWVTKIFSI